MFENFDYQEVLSTPSEDLFNKSYTFYCKNHSNWPNLPYEIVDNFYLTIKIIAERFYEPLVEKSFMKISFNNFVDGLENNDEIICALWDNKQQLPAQVVFYTLYYLEYNEQKENLMSHVSKRLWKF